MTRHHVSRREKRKAARRRFDFGCTWTAGVGKLYRAGWLPWRDEDTVRYFAEIKRLRAVARSRRNTGCGNLVDPLAAQA